MSKRPRITPRLLLDKADEDARPDWHEIPLGNTPVTLGRGGKSCDFRLPHGSVSSLHVRVFLDRGVYYLEDVSRNGVWLDNAKMHKNAPQPLADGAVIRLPGYSLTFDAGTTGSSSGIKSIKSGPPKDVVGSQSKEALISLICLSEAVGGVDLPSVFKRMSGALLRLFAGAERCLIIRWDDEARRGYLEYARRGQGEADDVRFSQTLTRRAVEDREGLLFRDVGSQPGFDAKSIDGIRSVISAPVLTPSGPWGVIQLDSMIANCGFTDDDLSLLMAAAVHLAAVVENVRIREELVELAVLKDDKARSPVVRLALLPQTPPRVPGYAFFAEHVCRGTLSGEYFDFVPLPDGRIVILLGEVGGGGVTSALGMSRLTSVARHALVNWDGDIAATMSRLAADFFLTDAPVGELALTAVLLDPVAHRATMVCAGPEPLLYRADRATVEPAGSFGVGPFRSGNVGIRVSAVHELNPKDRLVLPGAGLTGALNAGGKPFSWEGIALALAAESLIGWDPPDPVQVGGRVISAVNEHVGDCPALSDLTLICLGRVGPGEGETGLLEILRPATSAENLEDTSTG